MPAHVKCAGKKEGKREGRIRKHQGRIFHGKPQPPLCSEGVSSEGCTVCYCVDCVVCGFSPKVTAISMVWPER